MVKRFSISVLISGNLKKKIINITKKINRINQDKHVSIPHINILSGSYTDESKLLKILCVPSKRAGGILGDCLHKSMITRCR